GAVPDLRPAGAADLGGRAAPGGAGGPPAGRRAAREPRLTGGVAGRLSRPAPRAAAANTAPTRGSSGVRAELHHGRKPLSRASSRSRPNACSTGRLVNENSTASPWLLACSCQAQAGTTKVSPTSQSKRWSAIAV